MFRFSQCFHTTLLLLLWSQSLRSKMLSMSTSRDSVSMCSLTACQQGGYLQEVYEVTQHQPVELRQRLHHSNGSHWIITVVDALFIEVHGDEWFLQLSVPQLHQRGWSTKIHINVFSTFKTIAHRHTVQRSSTHQERWVLRGSPGSSTGPLEASEHSLHLCLLGPWG